MPTGRWQIRHWRSWGPLALLLLMGAAASAILDAEALLDRLKKPASFAGTTCGAITPQCNNTPFVEFLARNLGRTVSLELSFYNYLPPAEASDADLRCRRDDVTMSDGRIQMILPTTDCERPHRVVLDGEDVVAVRTRQDGNMAFPVRHELYTVTGLFSVVEQPPSSEERLYVRLQGEP